MISKYPVLALFLAASICSAQVNRIDLGRLQTGATVSFTRSVTGEWGIEIAGSSAPRMTSVKAAKVEVFTASDGLRELSTGYKRLKKSPNGVDAEGEIPYGDTATFRVHDHWQIGGSVLSVKRKVEVWGNAPGGFDSSVLFDVDPSVNWSDVNFLAPGALYGDPTYDGDRSPGGTLNYAARRFMFREDLLPAPLFGLSFKNGASVTVLDPSPSGDSSVEETKLAQDVMTDARFAFGALGAWQSNGPIEFGFWFPGSVSGYMGGLQAKPRDVRRFHPITQGLVDKYEVRFRFGQNESFPQFTRNSWRWAWQVLNPPVSYFDVDLVRRVLMDHLNAQAITIGGRTGIPFVLSTVNDRLQWNWTMIAMGFVGKDIECADLLLREGERDHSERGLKMRQTGLAIISSTIQALHTIPLEATGWDLASGEPWQGHIWLAPWLRNATEDMRALMRAYRRERALGRQHPEWLNWVKTYVDWLIQQQRADGSFPRRWETGTSAVAEPTGTTSYVPVPLLVIMSEETGDPKYQQAAIRAADYIWTNFGSRGLFVGGASDNPNNTDKEAGMLSMEAFLSLYDSTKDRKWLERAETAADYAESWIWIWNLPMPWDADNAQLHWKKGVSTVGIQGITARVAGSADEYLDWAVPSYAKLYNYTHDEHYLDVARVLLHDTKSMVALPGRQYDMKGIGWQQEGWRMGPGFNGRGVSGHRFWLPWISANHLYGIVGLEEYDPALFGKLTSKPAAVQTTSPN